MYYQNATKADVQTGINSLLASEPQLAIMHASKAEIRMMQDAVYTAKAYASVGNYYQANSEISRYRSELAFRQKLEMKSNEQFRKATEQAEQVRLQGVLKSEMALLADASKIAASHVANGDHAKAKAVLDNFQSGIDQRVGKSPMAVSSVPYACRRVG